MKSADSQVSMDSIGDVLVSLRKKRVLLWSEDGQLHYRAPKGALTKGEIETLRASRDQIIDFLEGATRTQVVRSGLELRRQTDQIPLTFSQLSHWHRYQLGERRHIRQIASAMRLRGRLNLDALRKSSAEIVHRHEALRIRIVVLDGTPTQEISTSGDCELAIDDLTALPDVLREVKVKNLIEEVVLTRIDVTVDPLFGIRLLKLSDHEHVLIMTMEHLISDAFSMNILVQELFVLYTQALKGRVFSLPPVPVQFPDYAIWQWNARKVLAEKRGAYWNARLAGCQRVRFPADKNLSTGAGSGWGTVPLRIGKELKAELRQWCRLKRTTLPMAVFAAYAGLVLRWCNAVDIVIPYVTDGRASPQLQNTIGCFAFQLCLRIELFVDDSLVDLMNRVTDEYCKAYEHADLFSYMEAQTPPPEIFRNAAFNWIPQSPNDDLSYLDESEDAIRCSTVPFEHPMLKNLERDAEPAILLFDADDEIFGSVCFPMDRFSTDTMERFARNFLGFIAILLRQSEKRVKDVSLPVEL